MTYRLHMLSCALVTLSVIPEEASAQEARPIRVRSARAVRTPLAMGLPPALARLPKSTAVALYAPRLDALLEDLDDLEHIARSFEPALRGRAWPEWAARALWGGGFSLGWSRAPAQPELARLATPEGARDIGLEPKAPVTVLFSLEAKVAVVRLGLADRPRFERWLDGLAGPERARVQIDGEQASVLAPDSDAPVTCLARKSDVTCQIGAARGGDPVAFLRTLGGERADGLGDVRGLDRAYEALPDGARLTGVLNTPALVAWLEDVAKAHEVRAHRFATPSVRARAIADARTMGKKARHMAAKVEGTAFAVYRGPEGAAVQLEVALSKYGARRIAPLLRPYGEHTVVSRWADTPALVKLVLRTHPSTTQQLLAAMDLELPGDTLTGDIALLTLGVDSECPMAKAKREAHPPGLSWAFLLPTAAAVGIAGPKAADRVQDQLTERLGAPRGPTSQGSRARIHGELGGSPFEIDVLDQVVLVGAGHGAGPAAVRRLRAHPPRAARRRPPLLEASVDLHAIDAAIASGSFDHEHRSELIELEAWRQTLEPLLHHVAGIDLSARADPRARRLSLRLSTRD